MAEMSRNTLLQYMQNLSEARLIQLLYSDVTNIKRLQKPDKIYLENTNMLHALATTQVNDGTEREVFSLTSCQQPMWWNTAKLLPTLPSTISTRLRSADVPKTASRLPALPIASSPLPTRSMCWGTRLPSGFSAFCISKDTRLHFPY